MYSVLYEIFLFVPIIGSEMQKNCDISTNAHLLLKKQ
jgi:hypothetical protein